MNYTPKKESTCTVAWYKAVLVPVFNQYGGLQSTNSNYQPVVNNVFLKSEKGTWNIEPYTIGTQVNYKVQCCIPIPQVRVLNSGSYLTGFLKTSMALFILLLF